MPSYNLARREDNFTVCIEQSVETGKNSRMNDLRYLLQFYQPTVSHCTYQRRFNIHQRGSAIRRSTGRLYERPVFVYYAIAPFVKSRMHPRCISAFFVHVRARHRFICGFRVVAYAPDVGESKNRCDVISGHTAHFHKPVVASQHFGRSSAPIDAIDVRRPLSEDVFLGGSRRA